MKKLFLSLMLLIGITACSTHYEPLLPKISITIDPEKVDFAELDRKKKVQDCNWGFLEASTAHRIKDLMKKNRLSKIYWVEYEEASILLWKEHCITLYAD